MSDIVLATGVQFSRDLPAGTTGIPRQEWLGAAGNSGGPSAIRLVGHKVLAQGAARTPRNEQEPEFAQTAEPRRDIEPAQKPSVNSLSNGSYASRAIANFSQQAGNLSGAKGSLIDTYA
jgi:hypothetical protein